MKKILYLVTEEEYFCSHRLSLALAALKAGYNVIVVTRQGKNKRELQNIGFKVINVSFSRCGGNIFREIALIKKLVSIYRQEKPDIVNHVALQPVIYGSIAAFLSKVSRVVNMVPGLGYVFISNSLKARFLRVVFKKFFKIFFNLKNTRIIVQNPDDKAIMLKIGVKQNHIILIYSSGVDLNRFVPVKEPVSGPVVSVVSRMLWDKGIGEFVEAIRILKNEGVNFKAWLVGGPDEGNPASITKEQLDCWQNTGLVECLGKKDNIKQIWAQSHVAVLPSYREGLPKSLLEAAACGKPIVTTDAVGCRETVIENENGYLVPVRDSKVLAERIKKLLLDADLRKTMGIKSRKMVEEKFSIEKVVRETLAVYDELWNSK